MHPELITLLAAARSEELRRAAQSHDLAQAARRPSRTDASLPLAQSFLSPRRHRLPSLPRSVRLLRRPILAVRGLWS